ncbi:hypothetical protein P7C73_g2617, partial [Tremellales sp. Uapishka_1]
MPLRIPLRAFPLAPRHASPRYSSSEASSSKHPPTSAPNPYTVPPLSRPLGIPNVPSSIPKTWAEKKEDLLNEDRHKAKRKALVKEASQGYFHDYNLARKANGGKLWVAPTVLIRQDRALYFPDITGKNLLGSTVHTTTLLGGSITLLTILNTRISEEHVQSFIQPVLEDWEAHPNFQYLQINHQPNYLKSILLSFFISSLKRSIPENRWERYLVSGGEWGELDIMHPLGIENKLLGYVFLIDADMKIRWAGCGGATEKETEDLRRAAAILMSRLGKEDTPAS